MNESESSTNNQPTQGDFDQPNERQYEYVDTTAFTLPQPFNHNSSGDGSLRNNQKESTELEETGEYVIQPDTQEENAHEGDYVIKNPDTNGRDIHVPPQTPQYEIPTSVQYKYLDQSRSHQYGCPSLNNKEADTMVKTDTCVQDSAYSPLAKPPLNRNEGENGGYTFLKKEEKTTAKKDKEDELLYVDVIDSPYTPLVRLKHNESEVPVYQSLQKINKKTEETNVM